MPEGIEATAAYPMENKSKFLKWLRVTGRFEYDDRDPAKMAEALRAFYGRERIVITRKTKRGTGEMDIRPAIREISFFARAGESVALAAIISAQNPTLNPDLLPAALRALAPEIAPDFAKFTRIETYDEKMTLFR
jgi:hypothetical protein